MWGSTATVRPSRGCTCLVAVEHVVWGGGVGAAAR
jgi:hypothetical protein